MAFKQAPSPDSPHRQPYAVVKIIKLAIEAGKANPSPPIGPALGAAGLQIMEFCKAYNAATQDKMGEVIPVEIFVMDVRNHVQAEHDLHRNNWRPVAPCTASKQDLGSSRQAA